MTNGVRAAAALLAISFLSSCGGPTTTDTAHPVVGGTTLATEPIPTHNRPSPSSTPSPPSPPSPTAAATETPAAPPTVASQAPRVDHTSIDLFDDIPDTYLEAAAALRMVFVDRSVGLNISQGLDCLAAPSEAQARHACTVRDHIDPAFNVPPTELQWARPGGYDRSRWTFLPWPEGMGCGLWREEVECFLVTAPSLIPENDVLSYQFSYLEVAPGSDIAALPGGFFTEDPARPDVTDLEAFEALHADKVFLYWTTSLARGIGTVEAQEFNEQMREYALRHGKPLFDVADILSHDPTGKPCFDNRDGIAYRDEDYPDDGVELPAICPHYTTERDGGHLGVVSAGAIRLAKAFWVLMAQVAGWKP